MLNVVTSWPGASDKIVDAKVANTLAITLRAYTLRAQHVGVPF